MDIFDIIIDRLLFMTGWRFYLPIIIVAAAAAIVYLALPWTSLFTGVFIFLVIVASCIGIGWQVTHDRGT